MKNKTLSKKTLICLMLSVFQITIIIKPVLLFLKRQLGIGIYPVALFEIITVPITSYYLTIFFSKKINFNFFDKKTFKIGYLLALLLSCIGLASDYLEKVNIIETILNSLEPILSVIVTPSYIISRVIILLTGWGSGWTAFYLSIFLTGFAIFPLFIGLFFSLIKFILNKTFKTKKAL